MNVNPFLSDLFFNYGERNPDESLPKEKQLYEEAKEMIRWLGHMGVDDLPTAEELVTDYLDRE